MAAGAAISPQQAAQNNLNIRNMLLNNCVPMFQQIFSQNIIPANQNGPVIVPVTNVGLIRGFLVVVSGTLHNNDGVTVANRTELGCSNLVSNFTLVDFNNITRINTPGWHVGLVNSAKQPAVFMGAYAPNVPVDYGNNWNVNAGGATIAANADGAVKFMYYVPCAYTANDLRGAMYAGLVNATAQLSITINPTPGVNLGDPVSAVYSGSNVVVWKAATNVTITVYQDYLDQVPIMNPGTANAQPVLPPLDVGIIYELKQVAFPNNLVQGQDFGIPFANFRTFLSTTLIVDNNGVMNVGTDINYFALYSANVTPLFKETPDVAALMARNIFLADPPKGVYHFSHRNRPINTQQFGNINLIVNPNGNMNNVNVCLVGFEDFAQQDQVSFAASLPSA